MIVFEQRRDFEEWLDDNYWFEDGYIAEITTHENEHSNISSVEIRIGYQIDGTLNGATPITLKEYIIKASKIKLWTFINKTIYNPDNCISGIETIDECDGIGFEVDVPGSVKLVCDVITVEGPFLKKSIRKPWVSESFVYFNIKEGQIPKPSQWIHWLDQLGLDVSWRHGGSEAKLIEIVPYPDYSGWFLQETYKIPSTQFGVFFSNIGFKKGDLSLSIQKYDSNIDILWDAVNRILPENIQKLEVLCGNCRFNRSEWLEYVNCKKIPESMYSWV
ncbi:MAG: hypothetical protein Q8936_21460 [Bacillota bacterium]|nr:hypothetical protein [Bacillota bacterium]